MPRDVLEMHVVMDYTLRNRSNINSVYVLRQQWCWQWHRLEESAVSINHYAINGVVCYGACEDSPLVCVGCTMTVIVSYVLPFSTWRGMVLKIFEAFPLLDSSQLTAQFNTLPANTTAPPPNVLNLGPGHTWTTNTGLLPTMNTTASVITLTHGPSLDYEPAQSKVEYLWTLTVGDQRWADRYPFTINAAAAEDRRGDTRDSIRFQVPQPVLKGQLRVVLLGSVRTGMFETFTLTVTNIGCKCPRGLLPRT